MTTTTSTRTGYILDDASNNTKISGHRTAAPGYILWDGNTDRLLSRHRTLRAAVMATRKHWSKIKRRGIGPYVFCVLTDATGAIICPDLIAETKRLIENSR